MIRGKRSFPTLRYFLRSLSRPVIVRVSVASLPWQTSRSTPLEVGAYLFYNFRGRGNLRHRFAGFDHEHSGTTILRMHLTDSATKWLARAGGGALFEPFKTASNGSVHRGPTRGQGSIGKLAMNCSSCSSLIPEPSPSRSTVSISPPVLSSIRVQVDVAKFAPPHPARVTMIRRLLFALPDSCVWNRSSRRARFYILAMRVIRRSPVHEAERIAI
jgi:hypothetical protein